MALRYALIAVWLAACGPGGDAGGTIDVTATVDRGATDFGVVRVTGLSSAERDRVTVDTAGLAVFATEDSVAPGSPTLTGTWRSIGDTIAFFPRFPPSSGVALWVRLNAARLGRESELPPRWWRFELSAEVADTAAPRLLAIHPAANTLPENLLRWYLEFSRPMRPGQALDHVRLLDAEGKEDRTAFLDTSEELWDPDGYRLTLLFDPGRVKRGIRTNLEQGRPLVAGRSYRLRVAPGWQDRSGRAIATASTKAFTVVDADHAGPDPAHWELLLPVIGGTDPIVASFGEPLDRALASRLIAVVDGRGEPVPGTVRVEEGERRWQFTPTERWLAERYQLQVSPELEDIAGNRPGRAFDHEAGKDAGGAPPSGPLIRWFEPRRRND